MSPEEAAIRCVLYDLSRERVGEAMWGNDVAHETGFTWNNMTIPIRDQDKPIEPFRGWRKRSWCPSWLWRMVASISTQDAMILAIEAAEKSLVDSLSHRLYGDPR